MEAQPKARGARGTSKERTPRGIILKPSGGVSDTRRRTSEERKARDICLRSQLLQEADRSEELEKQKAETMYRLSARLEPTLIGSPLRPCRPSVSCFRP